LAAFKVRGPCSDSVSAARAKKAIRDEKRRA